MTTFFLVFKREKKGARLLLTRSGQSEPWGLPSATIEGPVDKTRVSAALASYFDKIDVSEPAEVAERELHGADRVFGRARARAYECVVSGSTAARSILRAWFAPLDAAIPNLTEEAFAALHLPYIQGRAL
ncbi:MAG: hypothetical protein KGI79_02055 [Patescibacteria group bacterium]|nr:hypothetical protein [Patescibacteria group bacterium]MDE2116635.1 hypothetical protein [Patescibacteria group bacterium]